MTARPLSADEQRLWGAVMATVRPLRGVAVPVVRAPVTAAAVETRPQEPRHPHPSGAARLPPSPIGRGKGAASGGGKGEGEGRHSNTLDGSWDKRLSRGLVAPDASIDLHGHTLASAHALLDAGLARSIARGDRVLLLVTGKPPRAESERPHARGAIRAAVADWLAASRHADAIAAVRGAHPRHGGTGALYIVLRRSRQPA